MRIESPRMHDPFTLNLPNTIDYKVELQNLLLARFLDRVHCGRRLPAMHVVSGSTLFRGTPEAICVVSAGVIADQPTFTRTKL